MIQHVSIPVSDVTEAKEFYALALTPLGYKLMYEFEDAAGFMEGGHTSFWVAKKEQIVPTHIAFLAEDKEAVNRFHAAALEAGAEDNGAPGYRNYSPGYYAAFVLDTAGNNVEAVFFDPEVEATELEV